MALSDISTSIEGHNPSSSSYTAAETLLCRQIVCALFPLVRIVIPKPVSPPLAVEKLLEAVGMDLKRSAPAGASISIATWARTGYRTFVRQYLETKGADKDFPKLRDPVGVQLLLRKACKESDISDQDLAKIFPSYGAKKSVGE